MIYKSHYWKEPLLETASRLRLVCEQEIPDNSIDHEDHIAHTERDIMIGFFSIRKLIDSRTKVSKTVSSSEIALKRYLAKSSPSQYDRSEIEEHYDLKSEHAVQKPIQFVCNQIVHSFVFCFSFNCSSQLTGTYFASDRARNSGCYWIAIDEIARSFELVGSNYPRSINAFRDADGNLAFDAD